MLNHSSLSFSLSLSLYIYIYIWFLKIYYAGNNFETNLDSFIRTQFNVFKYCFLTQVNLLNIIFLAHCGMVSSIDMYAEKS